MPKKTLTLLNSEVENKVAALVQEAADFSTAYASTRKLLELIDELLTLADRRAYDRGRKDRTRATGKEPDDGDRDAVPSAGGLEAAGDEGPSAG